MTLALKYCGGCNSRYDRGAILAALQADFPELKIVDSADQPDFVLVLCGCPSRCADHEGLEGRLGKWLVDSPERYALVRIAMEKEWKEWTGKKSIEND